jgi:hypothetical protein
MGRTTGTRPGALAALLDDFEAAGAMLDTMEVYHRRVTDNGELLIQFGEQKAVPPEHRQGVDSLLGSHFMRPVYRPPMGTVESLTGSGRLDLLDNPELVAALTNWTAAVERLQSTQLDARQHFYDRIYPYLASRVDVEDLDKGFAVWLGHPLPFEQGPTDAYQLLADRELQNLLYVHWVLGMNALEIEIPEVRAALERIRREAELEVGKR